MMNPQVLEGLARTEQVSVDYHGSLYGLYTESRVDLNTRLDFTHNLDAS